MTAKEIPELSVSDRLKFIDSINFNISCWEWGKSKSWSGYGEFYFKKNTYPAHRVSYEFFNKTKIPLNLVIDHLCRNTMCVNPTHLEVVTPSENTIRGNGPSSINRRKTHCIHGHPFSGENLILRYIKKNDKDVVNRVCRICKNIKHKKYMKFSYKK